MNNGQFNITPCIEIKGYRDQCWQGWSAIGFQLAYAIRRSNQAKIVLAVECYPGVRQEAILTPLWDLLPLNRVYPSQEIFLSPKEIEDLIQLDLTDDPVFGRISPLRMNDFFDAQKQRDLTAKIASIESGAVLIIGPGASLIHEPDILIYADLPRWEAQWRFRRSESDNLGVKNRHEPAPQQYKQAFFVDWRVADRLKRDSMERWDYWLDTVQSDSPKMTTGEAIRGALQQTARRPFSVVPYFDPAPWGGKWMQEKFGLDPSQDNFGWSFNGVPEENSLLFDFQGVVVESPAINLVFYQPKELLGEYVFRRFGAEFPIRFDYLDTMDGGNLSFQVHPTEEYIRKQFGMAYTQDESYYIVDAGEDACVYLGLREGIRSQEMIESLFAAQNGGPSFNADRFAKRWPARKHDHFLIPAGTPHCSGRNAMVLEISATPYIFTFKLWDWGRLGLDGEPRPIHIHHGKKVIQWERHAEWTRRELINRVEAVGAGLGWREERTGLHELEFIETRRHWFTSAVPHHTQGAVNVLCLVQGESITVESPNGSFEPFVVRFGEVFIVPAAVGEYTISPNDPNPKQECVTIKAFVRSE
ncbi:MAG: class I mannose-6-phosphate isomerase [Candidatus Omnitrophota bacterium]